MHKETEFSLIKVVLLTLVYLSLETLVRDDIFNYSLTLIKDVKRDYELDWIMKHGHLLVSPVSYTVILAISLSVMDLKHTFLIFTAQAFTMMVFSFEKNLIKAPRPYFIDPDIPVEGCKFAEFGSPSGHSMAASTIYTNFAALLLKYY